MNMTMTTKRAGKAAKTAIPQPSFPFPLRFGSITQVRFFGEDKLTPCLSCTVFKQHHHQSAHENIFQYILAGFQSHGTFNTFDIPEGKNILYLEIIEDQLQSQM